ncbi:MAG: ATP-binding cassette domain-containing protein [Anaerolineales bacterium]
MDAESFVYCDNLVKIYKIADLEVVALQGLDLKVNTGEIMALVGPSGAGKSTLLNVIGGLDTPSAGTVHIAGNDLLQMKDRDRVKYKKEVVGFVWQQTGRNLLPYLTAQENVELPMLLNQQNSHQREQRAKELLDVVGLADRARFHPEQLSGGQQQRVAVAVALANNPPLLLGDELTGQIDSISGRQVYEALRKVNEVYGTTIILVTHDPMVSKLVNRVVAIRDGRTSTEIRRKQDAASGEIHEEEWVILDRVGRLQMPKTYLEKLQMSDRVKLRMEQDHVTVWPESKVREFIRLQTPDIPVTIPADSPGRTYHGPAIATRSLCRTFDMGAEQIHAVRELSLAIPAGNLVVIKGKSGSGKTTLLNLIAGIDQPTSGEIAVGGKILSRLTSSEKVNLLRREIGFIFQNFGLLPFLSVEENVEVPLRLVHTDRKSRNKKVKEMLALVDLSSRAHHRTYELSGGEQQRVAIARALINQPKIILADEPTGQLDTATGTGIMELMREIVNQTHVTILVASHDSNVWQFADRVIELKDGQLVN